MVSQARGAGFVSAALFPDFLPIEQAWSKLKTALRTAQARSRQALEEAVRAAVNWITSADAQHWFDHCGYRVQAA